MQSGHAKENNDLLIPLSPFKAAFLEYKSLNLGEI
jgi:hypothetical protein